MKRKVRFSDCITTFHYTHSKNTMSLTRLLAILLLGSKDQQISLYYVVLLLQYFVSMFLFNAIAIDNDINNVIFVFHSILVVNYYFR